MLATLFHLLVMLAYLPGHFLANPQLLAIFRASVLDILPLRCYSAARNRPDGPCHG